MMRVTIIVPALNEERHIQSCLAALAAARTGGCTTEIIVVDNGSSDRTADIARQSGARVLVRPGIRIAALRNAAAAVAGGDILAFVDADCMVSESWLSAALECFARTQAALVGSFYRNPPDAGWLAATAERITAQKRSNAGYVPAGNLLVTRTAFEAVGGFDERLETNEDVDFCARVRKHGGVLVCDPAIASTHLGVPRSLGAFVRREMWFGRTAFRPFWEDLKRVTNLRLVAFSLYFALLIAGSAAAAVVAIISRTPAPLAVPAAGLIAVLVWVCVRIGWRRDHWVAEVAYTLLYGFARGAALIETALTWRPSNADR
jgi:glycosyltransferase involved in cell wall biosynthesis